MNKEKVLELLVIVYIQQIKRKKGRKEIPLLWNEFKEKDFQSTLMPMMNQEPFGLFGISVYNTYEDDSHKFDYYIAVSSHMTIDNELDSYIVPAMTWAVSLYY